MRILCSTTPMDGAFGPFIALGRAFVADGHEVIVATGENLKARVDENGLEFVKAGLSAWDGVKAARQETEVAAAPPEDRIKFRAVMFGWVHPTAKLPELRELAASRTPDLIIHPRSIWPGR